MTRHLKIAALGLLAFIASEQDTVAQRQCDQMRSSLYQFAHQSRGDWAFVQELNQRQAAVDQCYQNSRYAPAPQHYAPAPAQPAPKIQDSPAVLALDAFTQLVQGPAPVVGTESISQALGDDPAPTPPAGYVDRFEPASSVPIVRPDAKPLPPGVNPFTLQLDPSLVQQQKAMAVPQAPATLPPPGKYETPQSSCNQYFCGSTDTFPRR